MFDGILNLVSSIINFGASENTKELADAMKKTNTNLRIEENNRAINKGDTDTIAGKLHEFSTLVPKEEKEAETKKD